MEIGIVDEFAPESGVGTTRVYDQRSLERILGKYLDEIAVLDRRLADKTLWATTPEKQKSRQARLDHLHNRCLPFVSDRINAMCRKKRDDFRDIFNPL